MRNMPDEEVTPACSWEETEKTIKEAGNMVLALFATAADAKCEACDYYDMVMTALQEESPEAPLGALTLDMADPACQEVADKLGVTEYPTVIAFKGGKELKRLLPTLHPEEDLAALKTLCQELE